MKNLLSKILWRKDTYLIENSIHLDMEIFFEKREIVYKRRSCLYVENIGDCWTYTVFSPSNWMSQVYSDVILKERKKLLKEKVGKED